MEKQRKMENNINKIIEGKLPEWLVNYWQEATKSIDCDPLYTFTAMLGMASIAVGTSANVEPKPYYTIYPGLYIAIVGNPSTKKSPAIDAMVRPLPTIQQYNQSEYSRLKNEYDKAKKAKNDDEELIHPIYRCVFISDTTMEAMAEELRRNPLGIIVKKDELAHFFKSLNSYKSGSGDLQNVLELYGNQQIVITRKNLDIPLQVNKPLVSILGGLQPEVLKEIFKTSDVGLIERFIFAFPEQDNTKRVYSRAIISERAMNGYMKEMMNLYRQSEKIVHSKQAHTYRFTKEADLLYEKWQNEKPMDEYLESMHQKAYARCAKFALLIEILNSPKRVNHKISVESLELAIEISELYIANHIKVLEHIEDGEEKEQINAMLKYLKKRYVSDYARLLIIEGKSAVKIRSIYSNKAGGTKGSSELTNRILMLMEEKGYGQILPKRESSKNEKAFYLFSKFWK